MEHVLDIVGDTMPENLVKEAIVRCDFNPEVAVNTLLNNPVGHRGAGSNKASPRKAGEDATDSRSKQQQQQQQQQPRGAAALSSASASKPPATTSSPMPIASGSIYKTPKQPEPKKKKKPQIIEVGVPMPRPKKVRSRSQSPSEPPSQCSSGRATPVQLKTSESSASLLSTPKATPMRKANVDVMSEYLKERKAAGADKKELLNLVVVGHVDSGKSTLMGHLLYRLGQVSKKAMHKYEQESRKLGKQSFAYAWVLDETSEERERGITMDVGQSRFETPNRVVTLLDAPGHRDFIPNMISGAYQADVAVLVVNAARGEFEAGFNAGGQTREHALLARSLGVTQLAVAVNKMDMVGWSQTRFDEITAKLKVFLKQVGFREADTNYVPCSGFTGDNLMEPSSHLNSWYEGGSLLDAVDSFKVPERLVDKPFRLSISDVFRPTAGSGFSVAGRVEAGYVRKDDKVLILPLNEMATVKSVSAGSESGDEHAFAGDHVILVLIGPDQTSVASGMVACDPMQPMQPVRRFRARVIVFNADVPITKGYPCVMHYGCVQVQASVKKLVAVVNKSTGEVIKNRPRCLTKNCNAVVEVGLDSPACLELYSNIKELGRFMLRSGGKTIAAGLVTDLL